MDETITNADKEYFNALWKKLSVHHILCTYVTAERNVVVAANHTHRILGTSTTLRRYAG